MTTDAQTPPRDVAPAAPPPGSRPRPKPPTGRGRNALRLDAVEGYVSESTSRGFIYAAASGFVNALLLMALPPGTPWGRVLAASAMLWVSTYPLLHVVQRKTRQVPLYPAISLLYFMYFGLPVFLDAVYLRNHPYEVPEVTTAVLLTLGGLVLMHVGFYSSLGKVADLFPKIRFDIDLERIVWFCIVIGGIGSTISGISLTRAYEPPPALRALANVAIRIPLLLLAGVYLLHLRGKLNIAQRLCALVIYAVYIALALSSGTLSQVVYGLSPLFFIYVAERGKLPWRAGLLCILIGMPFNHSKHAFRQAVGHGDVDPLDRLELFVDLTLDNYTTTLDRSRLMSDVSKASLERTSYLGTFAYVIHQTPNRVPYLEGSTYRVMLWTFVPRAFAPDKPMQTLGQDFGHRYRLLDPSDHHTSFNCAQIIEMYFNFGPLGVLLGMGIVGVYYRILYQLFNHGAGGDGILLIASAALSGLLNIESDAGIVLVGGIQSPIVAFVILKAVLFLANHVFVKDAIR